MSHPTEVIDRYIAMWNETDPERRRRIIASLWTDQCSHVDPATEVDGQAGIEGLVSTVQERFPGHRFRRTSEADGHHDHIRFSWELAPPAGPPVMRGTDFAAVAEDGRRLRRVTAFFDPLPGSRPLG